MVPTRWTAPCKPRRDGVLDFQTVEVQLLLPVFTALLAGVFLGERLTVAHVIGTVAVMVGVYLTVRPEARR